MVRRVNSRSTERTGTLWFGILGPPLIWAVRIAVSYVAVPQICASGAVGALHLVTLSALAAVSGAAYLAWRNWGAVGRGAEVETGGVDARRRFMARLGLLSAAFFFLVILAEGMANVFVDPCLKAGVSVV